jgi:hypothetical protein
MRLSMLIAALLLAAGVWSVVSGTSRLKFAEAGPPAQLTQASR